MGELEIWILLQTHKSNQLEIAFISQFVIWFFPFIQHYFFVEPTLFRYFINQFHLKGDTVLKISKKSYDKGSRHEFVNSQILFFIFGVESLFTLLHSFFAKWKMQTLHFPYLARIMEATMSFDLKSSKNHLLSKKLVSRFFF